jgi:uncharacterized protein (UPF0305 family)
MANNSKKETFQRQPQNPLETRSRRQTNKLLPSLQSHSPPPAGNPPNSRPSSLADVPQISHPLSPEAKTKNTIQHIESSMNNLSSVTENLPEELKVFLNILSGLMTDLVSSVNELVEGQRDRKVEVESLKTELQTVNTRMQNIENSYDARLTELENTIDKTAYQANRDIGFLTGNIPPYVEGEDPKNILISVLHDELNKDIEAEELLEVKRIKIGNANQQNALQFRVKEMKIKLDLVKTAKQLKRRIYINDFLPPRTRKLLNKALAIKRLHPQYIAYVNTYAGVVNIKQPNSQTFIKIRNELELENFLKTFDES